MSNFPKAIDMTNVTINTASYNSLGFHRAILGSSGLAAWPLANLALFVPFTIAVPTTIVKIMWVNGATVSGNVDVGLYDSQGNRLVSSGTTAQTTVSVVQPVDTTDVTLQPGVYYMAMAMDNTTGTTRKFTTGSTALCRAVGVYQQVSAFPLPSSATFATASTSDFIPVFGITGRIVV